jgi:regulator of nucleoside diphosphate kinase
MSNESCILTVKDFAILNAMLDGSPGADPLVRSLLMRKIRSATVVFAHEVPSNVATVNSRLQYRIDAREPEIRVISHVPGHSPVGMCLSLASPYGLALLGLAEGRQLILPGITGAEERISLERVLYQPESARRERRELAMPETPAVRRAMLRVIDGAYSDRPAVGCHASPPDGSGDPGPSAA